jgi:transposase
VPSAGVNRSGPPGDIGALLRREGIYSSHLATWRKHRQLAGEALLAEVERLRGKLAKADLIIDVQKNFPSFWD